MGSDAHNGALTRRAAMVALAAIAVPTGAQPAMTKTLEAPVKPEDETLMREAIALAAQGDFPFGAVIARDGQILARGFNEGQRAHDPTAHGEMVAIRRFLADHGPEALKGATLYTSGEPCVMCMGAIIWCGISRVVYAASVPQIEKHMGQIGISCVEIVEKAPFAHVEITGGVLADEALKLFR